MAGRGKVWDHDELDVYFYSRGAYNLAIAEFKRALRGALDPPPTFYVNLGAAYLAKKRYAEARECLEQALRIEPTHPTACRLLARLQNEEEAPAAPSGANLGQGGDQ